jgi:hypothetical protein
MYFRVKLYRPFQELIDKGYCLPQELSKEFCQRCKISLEKVKIASDYETLLNIGWLVGKDTVLIVNPAKEHLSLHALVHRSDLLSFLKLVILLTCTVGLLMSKT